MRDMEDFWVFGYGSLMWKPGFAFEERQIARAYGYRRSLCIRSWSIVALVRSLVSFSARSWRQLQGRCVPGFGGRS